MSTIEERAIRYCENSLYSNSITKKQYNYRGYVAGATAQRAIDEAEFAPIWNSSSERLPDKIGWYLAINKTCSHPCEAYYDGNRWLYIHGENIYWMPMPPAPNFF